MEDGALIDTTLKGYVMQRAQVQSAEWFQQL